MTHSKDCRDLLAYAGERNVFWAGHACPAPDGVASVSMFNGLAGYREDPRHHGKYSAVYLVDLNIGHHPQWPVILDEALRLIAPSTPAIFCVRFSQTQFLSVFAFAGYLERREDFKFEIVDQVVEDGDYTFVLSCERWREAASLDSFDFGMISNGSNIPALESFIKSVYAVEDISSIDWNVLICGPSSLQGRVDLSFLGKDRFRVRFIVEADKFQKAGWITRKKNLIVENSTSENILIAHDRFSIPTDFLTKLREFGGDFSLIVPRQIDWTGERVGDWVSIESEWGWAPQRLLSYEDYDPNIYVNGGIIVAKRALLSAFGWSDLLLWNQAEDVELTRRLAAHGVTPRMAPGVLVYTRQPRSSYVYNFRRVTSAGEWEKQPWIQLDTPVDFKAITPVQAFDHGLTIWSWDWSFQSQGLLLANDTAEVSCKFDFSEAADFILVAAAGTEECLEDLLVNGVRIPLDWKTSADNTVSCQLPLDDVSAPAVPQIVLWMKGRQGFCLKGLTLKSRRPEKPDSCDFPALVDGPDARIRAVLGDGWSQCEYGRVWSEGYQAKLHMPVSSEDRGKAHQLVMDLTGYGQEGQKNQAVMLTIGGNLIATADIAIRENHISHTFRIPAEYSNVEKVDIILTIASPVSPLSIGRSSDERVLGVSLSRIDWKAKRLAMW